MKKQKIEGRRVEELKQDNMQQWKTERRRVEELKPHPMQEACFHDLDKKKLRRLADDIRDNGQSTPIEIMEDGTILAGHQRWAAAKLLGWEEVRVRVRSDLSKVAAKRRFLEENTARRQLVPLDGVRTEIQLAALKGKCSPAEVSPSTQRDLRQKLAERLGVTDRDVRRMMNIASTPMPVQRAFQEGKVSLVEAEQVAFLQPEAQEEIVEAIDQGEDAARVIRAETRRLKETRPRDSTQEFFKHLQVTECLLETLDGSVADIRDKLSKSQRKQIQGVVRFYKSLLANPEPQVAPAR